jgi:hypothetical protein
MKIEASRKYQQTHRAEIAQRARERYHMPPTVMCCPICVQEFTSIQYSERVCAVHLNWLVTTCCVCHVVSFSDCSGYCMVHAQDNGSTRTLGFNKDHRYMLRVYGYEGYE